ncbi:alpha/beta fold hydrolase [Larsenimonas rhizosphaerae]|uniref:alpha/beta fold hydrolase n=1 Tax=Larsenimonas rhizosphaerae TaxID=2944682 RepID=UPI00203399C1|nr:alpha/beta hydrolase [Larsenimonas rhizosphaerae]MCM2130268.1 alpha/beta hydrolase [Larsenimonas rhizosphaerae]
MAHFARQDAFIWHGAGVPITVDMTTQGRGPLALLLPAISTVSTRHELAPLQARLAEHYRTVSVDWPGFGDRARPFHEGNAALMVRFLDDLLTHLSERPALVVAAGHGAGLALLYLKRHPDACDALALVAPTWRGPLPTMTRGVNKPWFKQLRQVFDSPVGKGLYWLNIRPWCIRKMVNEHVFEQQDWLNRARMAGKRQVPKSAGARHGSIRFVTGCYDAFIHAEDARAAVEGLNVPVLMLSTPHMPARSGENMQVLGEAGNVDAVTLPHGRLLMHEECPEAVYRAIHDFMEQRAAAAQG